MAAHRTSTAQYQEVDEWTAYWNDRADCQATLAHRLRPAVLQDLWQKMRNHHDLSLNRLRRYQSLHLAILHARQEAGDQLQRVQADGDPELDPCTDAIALRHCIASWQVNLETPISGAQEIQNLFDQFGQPFTRAMLQWLWQQSQSPDSVSVTYSFLELAFFWGIHRTDVLPRPHGTQKGAWAPTFSSCRIGDTLTVALVLRLIRHFFRANPFCQGALCHDINLMSSGVFTPLAGVALTIDRTTAVEILSRISSFTARRPVRRANDLARPFG